MDKRIVAINEKGRLIGQDHPLARLTDAECDVIRELRQEGLRYVDLAEKFEVSKAAIADICKFRRRAQTPYSYKQVVA